MKKLALALSALALAVGATAVVASPAAAAPTKGPVAACKALQTQDPEAYEFLATKPGGCVSSVASVGVEALMEGAFPSTAAAIGNCKFLESMSFFRFPPPASVYPVVFHEEFGDLDAVIEGLMAPVREGGFGMTAEQAAAAAPGVVAAFEANKGAFTARNRAGCVRVLKGLHSGALFGLVFGGL